MNHLTITTLAVILQLSLTSTVLAKPYDVGSQISQQVSVLNDQGDSVSLRQIIQDSGKPVNIVFIFGGGAMGHEKGKDRGGLWCPDSYEELHIIRSLKSAYSKQVGFFPIAVPPAHHTQYLGSSKGIFLQADHDSAEYQQALSGFIDSTQAAVKAGTIPYQTFYDAGFNFMASENVLASRQARQDWHGAFRAAEEAQTYGVPSLWIVDAEGRVLQPPFRGNIYHDHGEGILIQYTLAEVVRSLEAVLE